MAKMQTSSMANFLSQEKVAEVKKRILSGESQRDIAAAVGCSKNSVMAYRLEVLIENVNPDGGSIVVFPTDFKRPRYMNGAWLDTRSHWSDEDLKLMSAAADLGITPEGVANTLGRSPTAIAWKAVSMNRRIPRSWIPLIYRPKAAAPRLHLEYPYIIKPDDRHADLIAVNRMVSKAIPGREDVVQDVMLALWESRTSLAELRADPRALRAFVSSFRKASFERSGYGVESMDVTIHSDDGDGKSKYEDARYQRTLADPDDEFIEDNIFKHGRSTTDFSAATIAALSNEEETLGVPAAFWSRVEL